MRKSTPSRVIIPAIGVDSGLVRLGPQTQRHPAGTTERIPGRLVHRCPTPGENGPAIIAGHVHWAGRAGVFAQLAQLKPGDTITVTRQDHSTAAFQVSKLKQYPKATFPSAAVCGDIDHPGLRLITCGGLDTVSAKYEANLVDFADLIK